MDFEPISLTARTQCLLAAQLHWFTRSVPEPVLPSYTVFQLDGPPHSCLPSCARGHPSAIVALLARRAASFFLHSLPCRLTQTGSSCSRGYGATAAHLTSDQKVGSSNLSGLIFPFPSFFLAHSLCWFLPSRSMSCPCPDVSLAPLA